MSRRKEALAAAELELTKLLLEPLRFEDPRVQQKKAAEDAQIMLGYAQAILALQALPDEDK